MDKLSFCRLCQLHLGKIELTNGDEFNNRVFECIKIKLDDENMNILPRKICEPCRESINTFFDYIQQIRKVDQDLRYELVTVDNSKTSLDQLKGHSKKFECPVCKKLYSKQKYLQLHKRVHSSLFCVHCNIVFDDINTGENHNCTEQTEKEPSNVKNEAIEDVKTDWWDDEFLTDNKQKTELSTVNKKKSKKASYTCDVCNKMFMWKNEMELHRKSHVIKFVCKRENCTKICNSIYSFKTHEMKHDGERPFLCVTCGKAFTTKNSLNCHEKIHSEVKGYVCKVCNIGFSVASNLRSHEKKHHEGVRYYCSQCTRVFITKCSLERHELVHKGVKEFKCQNCPAAFYTNKELTKHQRYHQGLRQYKCDECFKTFFEKHHLTIHLRVHTGERPYVCKIAGCGKSFMESQKLSRHLKARHPPVL